MLVKQFINKTKYGGHPEGVRKRLQSAIDQGKDTAAISDAIEKKATVGMKPWEFEEVLFKETAKERLERMFPGEKR